MPKIRAYSYPVLSHQIDDYIDGSEFHVEFAEGKIDETSTILSLDYEIALKSVDLEELLLAKKIGIFFEVTSSATFFRQLFSVQSLSGTLELPLNKLFRKVEVTPLIATLCELEEIAFKGVNPEYGNNPRFSIAEGALVAYDTTVYWPLSFEEESLRNFICVHASEEIHPDTYEIQVSNLISIFMGKNSKYVHDFMRADSELKPLLTLSVYKDAIVHAIEAAFSEDPPEEALWIGPLRTKLESLGFIPDSELTLNELNRIAMQYMGSFGYGKVAKQYGAQ